MKHFFWLLLLLVACHQPADLPVEDWKAWAQKVEARYPVTDTMGHGPDIGSDEWARALQHRLQIIDDAGHELEVGSDAWRAAVEERLEATD